LSFLVRKKYGSQVFFEGGIRFFGSAPENRKTAFAEQLGAG
jgi:hypothetical protein